MTFTDDVNATMTALLAHDDDLALDVISEADMPMRVLFVCVGAFRNFAEHSDAALNVYAKRRGLPHPTLVEIWRETLVEMEAEG